MLSQSRSQCMCLSRIREVIDLNGRLSDLAFNGETQEHTFTMSFCSKPSAVTPVAPPINCETNIQHHRAIVRSEVLTGRGCAEAPTVTVKRFMPFEIAVVIIYSDDQCRFKQ